MAKLTHTNCTDTNCSLCLREHLALGAELDERTSNNRADHLGKFHAWLSAKGIEPETVHGWGTEAYFDERYISEYVASVTSANG